MTRDPVTVLETETLFRAARLMKEHDIGDVIVLDDTHGRVKGIVTDRDMVIRALAEDKDPAMCTLASIVSDDLVCVTPDDPVDKATRLMRDKAIRRLPVIDDGQAVGMISIGDLAQELDDSSALAEISSAQPNT